MLRVKQLYTILSILKYPYRMYILGMIFSMLKLTGRVVIFCIDIFTK